MNITITGSIAYDYLMTFPGRFAEIILPDQLQNLSLSFLVDSMEKQRGGTAPNIAYTLALLGGNPAIMATSGQDFNEYRAWLEDKGVNTVPIVDIENEYCASFFVNTDLDQNQIANFYAGAMAHAAQLNFAQNAPDTALTIISPNAPDAMTAYINECKRDNIAYIYDPSQQTIRLSGEELAHGLDGCFMLTINEYEFSLIMERTGFSEEEIKEKAGAILVTKGKEGSWLWANGRSHHIPVVPPQKVVDPTGAGDAFRGGLLRGIQLGLDWDVAGRMGALAATYVLEQMGTINHSYTKEQFISRYRRHFDDAGALDQLL